MRVKENPTWSYARIQSAPANLEHTVSDRKVGNILKAHGVEPAPDRVRHSTWKSFLDAHWEVLAPANTSGRQEMLENWINGFI